ncbi:MAG TPA: tetratricopeptide repeat protein [bacterium]|nr:tetratricopeptide repeat protein [bacterium]HPS29778.1 tetratricopeptide repeat protein [bacterium]
MVFNYEESFFSDLLLKKDDGTILIIKSLAQLQQKIIFREVASDDLFSKNGKDWESLSQIEQLTPFFDLIERKPETEPETKPESEPEEKAVDETIEKERIAKLEQEKIIADVAEKARIAKLETEKMIKASKKDDADDEFDKSFFDDEDIPKKRTGLKAFITIFILAAIGTAIYFFYFRNVEEKRIVAVREEPVQIENKEPVQVVEEKVAETKPEIKPEEKVEQAEKPEENVVNNEPAVKKESSPKKQESLSALCKRGWQTLDKGDNKKAIEIFRKALSIKSDHPDAHLGLGESFNAAGNKNEAKKHYKKYLELSPDAEDRLEIESILNNL